MLCAFQVATAFQCSGIRWEILSDHCFDQVGFVKLQKKVKRLRPSTNAIQTLFWQIFGTSDILIDVLIVVFPIYLVSTLQMGLRFKVIVAGVFFARIW